MDVFFEKYYFWLSYATSISIILPLVAGLYFRRKAKNTNGVFRSVFLYIFFIALVEASGWLSVLFETGSNVWISHVYVPIEGLLLASIYYMHIRDKKIRWGIIISVFVFLLFCLVDSLFLTGVKHMNGYSRVAESSLLIGLAILYLYTLYKDLNYVYLGRDPMFVLSCGVMIFFAGTAMAYEMFDAALAESANTARICLCIVYVLSIAFNVVLVEVQRKALRV
ncbi:hypothetical protein MKJ04_06680 [Pontibacter sp. E15-1]|uniref:hypothetical protein n=1 Tax=Pontibacter sp. E15-1 TaxID=2919918 RepID=UPI001F4F3DBF|nr:hypothetical protein [Pontibacter sp. E15-1]MCJ8164526.1 hypothetical protein [Pontibacter sp. E15-1]